MKYKHIFWDWNGTIVDDLVFSVNKVNETLVRCGLDPVSLEKHRSLFSIPVQNYYKALGVDFSKIDFHEMNRDFQSSYDLNRPALQLQSGSREILEYFRDLKITQSVVSALSHEQLHRDINHFDLASFFFEYVGLHPSRAGSSKIDNGKNLAQKIKLSPKEIVMVGDTAHDYEVAQAIGCDCILLAHGHQDRDRLSQAKVPVVETFTDLKGILS